MTYYDIDLGQTVFLKTRIDNMQHIDGKIISVGQTSIIIIDNTGLQMKIPYNLIETYFIGPSFDNFLFGEIN